MGELRGWENSTVYFIREPEGLSVLTHVTRLARGKLDIQ